MRISRRFLIPALIILFFGYLLLELFHLYLVRKTPGQHGGIVGAVKACLTFINHSNLPAFVAGGIAARAYLYGGSRLLERLKSRVWTYLLIAGILVMMFFIDVRATGFVNILSLVYAWLILNLILRNAKAGRLQGVLARGGEISYGIYIYHPAIFILVSALLKKASLPDPVMAYILYLIISVVLIMAVSALSYRYLEQPFLRRKYTPQKAGGQ
jgi:peptidoglycan/LPS O-acetylase OafA/YrhL